MNIWNIWIEEMNLEELVVLQQDSRIKFAFDTAFVLNRDKESIEEKFNLKCIRGEEVLYHEYCRGLDIPFEFDLLNVVRDELNMVSELPELYDSNFQAWLDNLNHVIMDNLLWCNENSECCQQNLTDLIEGLKEWDQLKNAVEKGWITKDRFKEITGQDYPEEIN